MMGLDATVYCNCFETGALREPPPRPDLIYVAPDGSLGCRSENSDTLRDFDEWLLLRACEYENGILLRHRICNLTDVGLLRGELKREAEKFSFLLGRVIFIHAGGYISVDEVRRLQGELRHLAGFVCSDEANQGSVEWFRRRMQELAEAALHVGKPISF